MIKRAEFWIGLLLAAIAFAVAHGAGEFWMACAAKRYVVVDGVRTELAPGERAFEVLIDETSRAFPYGLGAAVVLAVPLSLPTRGLRFLPANVAYTIAVGVGALTGGFASIVAWIILGGWGPPVPFSAVAAGAVLSPALAAAWRATAK